MCVDTWIAARLLCSQPHPRHCGSAAITSTGVHATRVRTFLDHAQYVHKLDRGGKNGTNEFGYEKRSCIALTERIHDLDDQETPRERRDIHQQEVVMLATKEVQDNQISGRPLNHEASKEAQ